MQILFNCFCSTQWGQEVYLSGSTKELGNWDPEKAIALECSNLNQWKAAVNFKKATKQVSYKFFLREKNTGTLYWESGKNRIINTSSSRFTHWAIYDYWRIYGDEQDTWNSSVFSKVIFQRPASESKKVVLPAKANKVISFEVKNTILSSEQYLAICGNTESLGSWNVEKAIPLNSNEFPIWKTAIALTDADTSINYKYLILNKSDQSVIWEIGGNRQLNIEALDHSMSIINDNTYRYPPKPIKGAGVSVPVFSLKTSTSFGVGDFSDLKKLVDWSVKTNLRVIQLLPINDTISTKTFLDSYPYKAISVFALHPMFLNIFKMGKIKDAKTYKQFQDLQVELNEKPDVDYNLVVELKLKYAHLLYKEKARSFLKSPAFKAFYKENSNWLIPYASFAYLRDKKGTSDFSKWGEFTNYQSDKIEALVKQDSDTYAEIAFWYFIQFHLDKQLKDVTAYGRTKGIAFKGDIPIGISRHSVDAWHEPELYHFNGQAGAPPDDFSIDGQNWGFPTYNWEVMEKDNYHWWQKRLSKMAEYFDTYRIDHILGFFRIWEIPVEAVQGILGYFRPALPFHTSEIEEKGVWFDYNRFCKPYIRSHFLYDIFGALTELASNEYLLEIDSQIFELKEAFNTQQKIHQHFLGNNGPESLSTDDSILYHGLIQLAANVLFIPDKQKGGYFHPRISMHSTRSFQDLDEHHKGIFDALYVHYFYHRHEEFWKAEALKKLPALAEATDMLICGEDLGMIPASVPDVMRQFNMLSLEIQRMPKDPKKAFAHPGDAPYLSVCTTSTHDMPTIRGWWEENREESQIFYNTELGQWGKAPYYAEPWLCDKIIEQHLHSPAMWTIFPIQDLLSIDGELRNEDTHGEQINVPANPRHYWKYRMHLNMEELNKAKDFNKKLADMIDVSGRKIE